jgi:hypothetical protein
MWLFSKCGHFSVGHDAFDHDLLIVHTQLREEIESVIAMLDEAGGQRHEIEERVEGDYRFAVKARREVVAATVAKMVAAIDYVKHVHSLHINHGSQPGFFLWLNKTGLQVATVRE